MHNLRSYSVFDRLCLHFDQALQAISGATATTGQPYPAATVQENELTPTERKHAAGLMRVNHAGEICAQALYHGQAVVSRSAETQEKMQQAAIEEGDHLAWCAQRLTELESHTSYLNPLWYAGSFGIGLAAGLAGDSWSLGFVAETERQVLKHLAGHVEALPAADQRSLAVLRQMEQDEAKHRDEAMALGARELPWFCKQWMAFTAKIMVKTAYWL